MRCSGLIVFWLTRPHGISRQNPPALVTGGFWLRVAIDRRLLVSGLGSA
jgi:hypothetical protein